MMALSLPSSSSLAINNKHLSIKSPQSHRTSAFCRVSPQLQQLEKQHLFSALGFNPLRLVLTALHFELFRHRFREFRVSSLFLELICSYCSAYLCCKCRVMVMSKKRRRFGAVCYSSPLTPANLEWISAVSTAVLMLAKGTAIHKSFLVPLFALQAPANIVSWMKGEYGIWTAFLALIVRLFFFIPGELELPFITLMLVIVSPYQIMRLRGTQEGVILSLVIAAYLAFQHFTRAGSLAKSFDQGSILATLATICVVVVPCLLLI